MVLQYSHYHSELVLPIFWYTFENARSQSDTPNITRNGSAIGYFQAPLLSFRCKPTNVHPGDRLLYNDQ